MVIFRSRSFQNQMVMCFDFYPKAGGWLSFECFSSLVFLNCYLFLLFLVFFSIFNPIQYHIVRGVYTCSCYVCRCKHRSICLSIYSMLTNMMLHMKYQTSLCQECPIDVSIKTHKGVEYVNLPSVVKLS